MTDQTRFTDRQAESPDELLDRAIRAAREDVPAEAALQAAASRVWRRLSAAAGSRRADGAAAGELCAGYRTLLAGYAAGRLSAAQVLLVEDHLADCVRCRRELSVVRAELAEGQPKRMGQRPEAGRAAVPAARLSPTRLKRVPVRAALLALAAAGVGLALAVGRLAPAPVLAQAGPIDGALYRVTRAGNEPLSEGQDIRAREEVRTGRGGGAVLVLTDGSRLEVAARSQLALGRQGGDMTIRLRRGRIIVRAADQGRGRLWAVTDDCRVAVAGTIFALRHGVKGSRVSVIQGQVQVFRGDEEVVLEPGQQVATDPRVRPVPIDQEIAWSRNAEDYLALLAQLQQLRQDWQQIPWPGLRTGSRFLAGAPEDTVIYIALPNLSSTLAEAYRLLEERLAESPVLREWWQSQAPGAVPGRGVAQAVQQIETWGRYFGQEIVLTASLDQNRELTPPVIMAELAAPADFRAAVEAELASRRVPAGGEEMAAGGGGQEVPSRARGSSDQSGGAPGGEKAGGAPMHLVDDQALAELASGAAEPSPGLLVWTGEGLLVAGVEPLAVQRAVAALRQLKEAGPTLPEERGLAGTGFGAAIRAAYADGISWLMALDVKALVDAAVMSADEEERGLIGFAGLANVKHLVIVQRKADTTETRATLTFDGPRQGMASWLAEPAPMGALDYLTGDAYLASAFVVREPGLLLAEALDLATAVAPELEAELAQQDAQLRLGLLQEVAAAVGGELAVALDGPLLPRPSWKVVVEVYDVERMQQALERMLVQMNADLRQAGQPELALEEHRLAGRRAYTLRSLDDGHEILHYVYVDGYLIAAPARVLLERAIQAADNGTNLAASADLAALLPHDGRTDVSALVYQNLQPVLAAGSSLSGGALTPEQQAALARLGANWQTSLAYAYAGEDSITFASTADLDPLGLGLNGWLGLGGLPGWQEVLGELSRDRAGLESTP